MKKIAAIVVVLVCTSAWAFGTLVSQTVNGNLKYCKYSNGVIITVANYELCPVTIN